MAIIALFSMKGGVGKTATAVNLAYEAAQSGSRVLLCDLDAQGAAAFYFRIRPKKSFHRKHFLKGGKHIDKNIRGTDFENLDLLPSALSFRNLDLSLNGVKGGKSQLQKLLSPLLKDYDHIFLDCPPNLTRLAENIFRASDCVMIPCIPTTLSMMAYQKVSDFFKKNSIRRKKLLPFFSMVEKRKTMHREIITHITARKTRFLNTQIPYASDVERMGVTRQPVSSSRPSAMAARAYQTLWAELQTKSRL